MQTNNINKEIKKIIKDSDFSLEDIMIGILGEDNDYFKCYMRLAGRGLVFRGGKLVESNLNTYSKIREIQQQLFSLYHNYDNNINEIQKLIKKQRMLGLKLGTITLAYTAERINENSTKSYYGNFSEHYAPYTLHLYNNIDNILETHTSKCLESEFSKSDIVYKPMEIHFLQPINEKDIPEIYSLIDKIVNVYNENVKNEYNKNFKSEQYQHRHDIDPENI